MGDTMRRQEIYLEIGNVAMNLDGHVGVIEQVISTCSRVNRVGCSQPMYLGHRIDDPTLMWTSISPVKLGNDKADYEKGGAKRLKEARANKVFIRADEDDQ